MYTYEQMISLVDEMTSLFDKMRLLDEITEKMSRLSSSLAFVDHDMQRLDNFIYAVYAEKDNAVRSWENPLNKDQYEDAMMCIRAQREESVELMQELEAGLIKVATIMDSESFSRSNLSSIRQFLVDKMMQRDRALISGTNRSTSCEL
jgi:hypothetical protein